MQSSPDIQGFALPTVVNPPDKVCYTIEVPNDPAHIAAFLGVLYDLTLWVSWQRDTAHTAIQAAQVWKAIWTNLVQQSCAIPPIPIPIDTGDVFMSSPCEALRWHNGVLQGLCCGEWTDIPSDGTAPIPGQGGQPNSATTPSAGGTACNTVSLFAGNKWLLPYPVNTGDTLSVTDYAGGWTGGGAGWTYANGVPYVFAHPVGSPYHWPGDPDGTAFHGQLCYLINGSYYPATGGPFTVPSGITNAQCELVGNFASTLLGGTISFKVCYTNNATPPTETWCHYLDFRLSDYGFVRSSAGGSARWVSGTGWTNTPSDNPSVIVDFAFTGPVELTYIKYWYIVDGSLSGCDASVGTDAVSFIEVYPVSPSPSPQTATGTHDVVNPAYLRIFNTGCSGEITNVAMALEVHGKGTDPFGTPNC